VRVTGFASRATSGVDNSWSWKKLVAYGITTSINIAAIAGFVSMLLQNLRGSNGARQYQSVRGQSSIATT
jgi:hypothetical protein